MACAHDAASATLRIERHAHRRHEGTGAENAAKIAIDCTHDFRRGSVSGVRVMKKQFRQRGQQRCGRAMAGGISNPKKHPAVAHAKPAVNIAPHLNDRPIKPRNLPPGQHWWCGWNQRALRSLSRVKVLFQISAPRLQFFVLLEQLFAHRTRSEEHTSELQSPIDISYAV